MQTKKNHQAVSGGLTLYSPARGGIIKSEETMQTL